MSTVFQMVTQPGDVPPMGQLGPGGHVLWWHGDYQELSARVRLCGRQGRSGWGGKEAWSMGQAQKTETKGIPFLEVREEHSEFKAQGGNAILTSVFCAGDLRAALKLSTCFRPLTD